MQSLKEIKADEVFIINDINLTVPPSSIQVNQEDLLYSWKTLRTKQSTKIASGRGQIRISVNIYFTNSMMLSLHRLIVELSHSPFCVIKNAFLRHTIVPDWPEYQQMAFSLNAIQIAPLIDSSDTWMCELDLTWFNYFPYSHNFLFREDWTTKWIEIKENPDFSNKIKTSIGWRYDDENDKRIPRFSVVDVEDSGQSFSHKRWSVSKSEYILETAGTIEEMEALHYGETFDLLPAPSNMEPANFVLDPRNSRIYTRYINNLQRDALLKNFNVYCEKDLKEENPAFFATVKEDGVLRTYSLASDRVPQNIRNKWITQMLETNSSIKMHFHLFKTIKLDEELLEGVRESLGLNTKLIKSTKAGTSTIISLPDSTGGPGGDSVEVRNGFWDPKDIMMPLAHTSRPGVPATIAEALTLVRDRVRFRENVDSLYNSNQHRAPRMHKGTDFSAQLGTNIFAVQAGTVIAVGDPALGNSIRWKYSNGTTVGEVKDSAYYQDWLDTMISNNIATKKGWNNQPNTVDPQLQRAGVIVRNTNDPTVHFFSDYNDGGAYVIIEHDNGSQSSYMHLGDIYVSRGQGVARGQIIAKSGKTSGFSKEFVNIALGEYKRTLNNNGFIIRLSPETLIEQDLIDYNQVHAVPAHLHFEYYETRNLDNPATTALEVYNAAEYTPGDALSTRVIVDPIPSLQEATNKSLNYLVEIPRAKDSESPGDNSNDGDFDNVDNFNKLVQTIHELNKDGWEYYTGSTKIADLWHKVISIDVTNQNSSGPDFLNQDAVLMNVNGGLRHIAANIPILSHEYPTQQHLGSIEPIYNIDFAIRDDSEALDGLSAKGRVLQSMRNLLQHNGRAFRLVPDGWCLSTDTFITRLFGSYKQKDYVLKKVENVALEEHQKVYLPNIAKRTSIMRSSANTSPDNPGVSFINFEIQETNPYANEKILPTATNRFELDTVRKAVLKKLYDFNFLKFSDKASLLALAGASVGGNVTDPTAANFGKVELPIYRKDNVDKTTNSFVYDNGISKKLLLKSSVFETNDAIDIDRSEILLDRLNLQRSQDLPEYIELQDFGVMFTAPTLKTSVEQVPTLGAKSELVSIDSIGVDISSALLNSNANTIGVDVIKAIEYRKSLSDLIHSTEKALVEHSSSLRNGHYTGDNGLTEEEIRGELFDLPIQPKMWRAWQNFLAKEFYSIGGSTAHTEIIKDPTWLMFDPNLTLDKRTILEKFKSDSYINYFSNDSLPFAATTASGLLNHLTHNATSNALFGGSDAFGGLIPALSAENQKEALIDNICQRIVLKYSGTFEGMATTNFISDTFSYNNLFSELFGATDKTSSPRAFESFIYNFRDTFFKSGYITTHNSSLGTPVFFSKTERDFAKSNEDLSGLDNSFLKSGLAFFVAPVVDVGSYYQNGFQWKVKNTEEKAKTLYFKDLFAELADGLIQDPEIMQLMGLLEYSSKIQRGNFSHTDAYPDLELPQHPIFGDTLSTEPDFYIWNIYDDGQAYTEDVQNLVKQNLDLIVNNSYNSLKAMERGKVLDPKAGAAGRGLTESSSAESSEFPIVLKYSAEATDTGAYGPMGASFNMIEEASLGANSFFNFLTSQNVKTLSDAANLYNIATSGGRDEFAGATSLLSNVDKLLGGQANISMSAAEGPFGTSNGGQYKPALTAAEYSSLRNKTRSITDMFGTKEGFQKANITKDNLPVSKRLTASLLDRPDEYSHQFDISNLSKLALDSSKDIVSRRMSMRRAYPTFKLFFVEEDETESSLLNLDDFYSYNAVHSFTCEMSKSSPADHLVITLQNVSGVLDGTNRNAVADLDYFTKGIRDKVGSLVSLDSGNVLNKDTDLDQSFSSIVLRPGINVQLRAGYSNDPDMLTVLISGRVVDVQWNKNGDLVELMVQSYGTELIQQVKGMDRGGDVQTFYTTHELLGNLMLSPELTHFGRWEIGKLYQIGESTDYRLDFTNYAKEAAFPDFYYAESIKNWAEANPMITVLGGFFAIPAVVLAAGFDVATPVLKYVGQDLYENTVTRLSNYFVEKQVSLFLTPQDDNLFPPHPKDYMYITNFSKNLGSGNFEALGSDIVRSVHSRNQQDAEAGDLRGQVVAGGLTYLFSDILLFNKKAFPKNYQYQLISTTIWKVFHEMTLRHPGWVYGARPYGNEYRYTMFFGVPSQRYWSRGASNNFIKRMNDIYRFLEKADFLSGDAFAFEYKKIYGSSEELDEYKTATNSVEPFSHPKVKEIAYKNYEVPYSADGIPLPLARHAKIIPVPNDFKYVVDHTINMRNTLTGKALKEYLNGLNFRFVPFRKYHLFSSERNLVWNGLLSTENAISNAVDVTYFNETSNATDPAQAPLATKVIQAHSFIPQHMLKITPVRWPNCKGENLAHRYGMGELIHRMKNMYRGEIIVLGNARVRPWDIAILTDLYNDMVGPIEIDQVIHNFSHETGFITEVKPAAVVIGNETSSWPIIEAMKTFSLAVQDIENNYIAMRGSRGKNENSDTHSGFIGDIAAITNDWATQDLSNYLRNKRPEVFNSKYNTSSSLEDLVFGGKRPGEVGAYDVARIVGKNTNKFMLSLDPFTLLIDENEGVGSSLTKRLLIPGGIGSQLALAPIKVFNKLEHPSLSWLVGAPILFLQCLRQDSVVVIPLMKNGIPITSGLSYSDPTMIWTNIRGELKSLVDDTIDGTRSMLSDYYKIGTHIWNNFGTTSLTGE